MDKLLDIPHFENEEEEANWWFENRDKVTAAFERAAKEGQLRQRSGAIAVLLRLQGTLNLRIAGEDLAAIRRLASRDGQRKKSMPRPFCTRLLRSKNAGRRGDGLLCPCTRNAAASPPGRSTPRRSTIHDRLLNAYVVS